MINDKDMKDTIKKINKLFLPWVSSNTKKEIINEIGIEKITDNISDYTSKSIALTYHQLTKLMLKYNKEYVLEELKNMDFNNMTFKSFDVFLLSFYSSRSVINEFINLIPKDVALNILKNRYSTYYCLNKMSKKRKDIEEEIIDQVKNKDYENISKVIPKNIGKRIIKLGNETITSIMKNYSIDEVCKTEFFGKFEEPVSKAIKADLENDKDSYLSYLQQEMPISIKEFVIKALKLSDEQYRELVTFSQVDKKLYEIIYKHRKDIIEDTIKYEVEHNDYDKYLGTRNEEILKYVTSLLSRKQLLDVFMSDSFYIHKDKIYSYRKDEINEIILDEINKDRSKIFKFLNYNTPEGLVLIYKNIEFTKEEYLMLFKGTISSSLFDKVYNIKEKEIKEFVKDELKKDHTNIYKFINFFTPDDLVDYIIEQLDDKDIVDIFKNKRLYYNSKDLYDRNSEKLFKILDAERKRNHRFTRTLIDIGSVSLTNKLLHDISDDEILLVFDLLSDEEQIKLFKSHEASIKKAIDNMYNERHTFEATFFCNDSDNELIDYAFSLLTPDDLFRIMTDTRGYSSKVLTCCKKKYKPYIYDVISKKMEEFIINGDIESFVHYSNKLFFTYKGLFYTLFDHINMDEELLMRLFNERTYEDLQKQKIFEPNKDKIMNYVSKEINVDVKNAKKYLNRSTPSTIVSYIITLIGNDNLKMLIDEMSKDILISEEEEFLAKLYISTYSNKNDNDIIIKLIESSSTNKLRLARNFGKIAEFLNKLNINSENFWQYSLNVKYDYINDILTIMNGNIEEFKLVKDYFYTNIFKNDKFSYNDLFLLTNNFNRYKELCLSLANENKKLTSKELSNLMLLFNKKDTLENKPTKISECENITRIIKETYRTRISRKSTIEELKNTICLMLFNSTLDEMKVKLYNYGNTEELIKLEFNNRNNKGILNLIRNTEEFTKIVEFIILCENKEEIFKLAKSIFVDYDTVLSTSFNLNYDEIMQRLYANETNANLTKIDNFVAKQEVLDEFKTKKYGIETYNFSDKKYALYAHVKSSSESVEELVNGIACGDKNFISFSAITNRMESFYYGGTGIIFGYDEIPVKNFIYSSKSNLGSNGTITKNSTEYQDIYFKERGIAETSDALGNSEILCFREGIKPKYIIIPEGRKPTQAEIAIAKNNGLKLCLTQERGKCIEEPKQISTYEAIESYNLMDLKILKDKLEAIPKITSDKVAIITDTHALFEPLLAVLEDARRKGIKEIYSLGDNVGTGPNPKEVLDLLERYGVKSIKGNHEEYVIKGVDAFKPHFDRVVGSYDEAASNVVYTKSKLTQEQLEKIKNYPNKREITVNGKKILLTHFIKDYNTEEVNVNPKEFDYVLQGHVHFKGEDDNVITLKGVGIGNTSQDEVGKATYYVLSPENDYVKISEVTTPYDIDNTCSEIASNQFNTKEKIKIWIGK